MAFSFLNKLPTFSKEILRTGIVIVVVLILGWGISNASKNDLDSATENFSVIGTVSSISNDSISLIKARGSDTTEEDLYNLNINYLDKVETNTYEPLIISDIHVGDTIIAQGLTNGSVFFIKRIVSFSSIPFERQDVATSTDAIATSTEEVASSTQETATTTETEGSSTDTPIETPSTSTSTDQGVILEEPAPVTEEPSTTTEEATSSSSIIDTVSDIVDTVVIGATDVLDTVSDIITPTQEPTPEQTPTEPAPDTSQ